MKTMKKNKTVFKQPSFELSKNDVERKEKAYSNFFEGAKRQVKQDLGKFSSFNMIKNLILRKKEDPTNELILEIIKRMEKDKLQANISMHIAQKAQDQSQNIQCKTLRCFSGIDHIPCAKSRGPYGPQRRRSVERGVLRQILWCGHQRGVGKFYPLPYG